MSVSSHDSSLKPNILDAALLIWLILPFLLTAMIALYTESIVASSLIWKSFMVALYAFMVLLSATMPTSLPSSTTGRELIRHSISLLMGVSGEMQLTSLFITEDTGVFLSVPALSNLITMFFVKMPSTLRSSSMITTLNILPLQNLSTTSPNEP